MARKLAGGASPTERAGRHIESAFVVIVIQAILGAFGQTLNDVQTLRETGNIEILFAIMASLPGLLTLAGWIGAFVVGGPLGVFGFPIGAIGGSMMMPPDPSPIAGFFLVLFGGTLTWLGIQTGGWKSIL